MDRPIPNRVHGTPGGYSNWHCRCSPCTEANRAKQERWRDSRDGAPVPTHVHGTSNGYTNYRCRCERCTRAHSNNTRDYRRALRSQSGEN